MSGKQERIDLKNLIKDFIAKKFTYDETAQYLQNNPWKGDREFTNYIFSGFSRSNFAQKSIHQNQKGKENQQKQDTEAKINSININTSQKELDSIRALADQCELTDKFNQKTQQIKQQKQQTEEQKQKQETEAKINSINISTSQKELDSIKKLADQCKLTDKFNQRKQQIEQQKQQSEKQKQDAETKINSITIDTSQKELDSIQKLADQYGLTDKFNQRKQQITQQQQQTEEQKQKQDAETKINNITIDTSQEELNSIKTLADQYDLTDLFNQKQQQIIQQQQQIEQQKQDIKAKINSITFTGTSQEEFNSIKKLADQYGLTDKFKERLKQVSTESCRESGDGNEIFFYEAQFKDWNQENPFPLRSIGVDTCKNRENTTFCSDIYICAEEYTLNCNCTTQAPVLDLTTPTEEINRCITKKQCEPIGQLCPNTSCISHELSCNELA